MDIPMFAQRVCDALKKCGYEAYFVGGCVRDTLLGREVHDYDITSNALPEEIKKCFDGERVISVGEKHGTVGVMSGGNAVEVTTYRLDGEYTDNRHPKSVKFTEKVEDDLARRDFTMNAIAYDGQFKDPFGGREDIEKRLIRCVGEADRRFGEDALRILRAMRFSSVLGFEIEDETRMSMHKNRELIKNISAERIYSEFKKIITGKNAESVLLEFADIISVFIPEIKDSIGFEQKNIHHIFDVYTHSVKAAAACPFDEKIRLAALFHDIGKPCCYTEDEAGGHFYSHPKFSRELTQKALERLKADTLTKETVLDLVFEHDRMINADKKSVRRVLAKYSPEFFDMLMEVKRGDIKACAPPWEEGERHIGLLIKIKEEILRDDECLSIKKLKVNGNDMLSLGLKGREIGAALEKLLDAVLCGEVKNERGELMDLAKKEKMC